MAAGRDAGLDRWPAGAVAREQLDDAAGVIAGKYLKSVLSAGDSLGILEGVPGVPALDDRVNGMLEGLDGLAVEIVGRNGTNCTEELGISVAEDLLTANPGLKAINGETVPALIDSGAALVTAVNAGEFE